MLLHKTWSTLPALAIAVIGFVASCADANNHSSDLLVRNFAIKESSDTEFRIDNSVRPFTNEYRNDGTTIDLEIRHSNAEEFPKECKFDSRKRTIDNSFAIEATSKQVTIYAADYSAALYSIDEINRRLVESDGILPLGVICDAPDNKIRALHIISRFVPISTVEQIIRQARDARFNTLIIHFADGVSLNSKAVDALPNAWSREDVVHIVDLARENGLDVIPQVALLTHQEKFFAKSHPDLMWNHATYDPTDPRVYEIVYEYLDEVIDLIHPHAIHIGHDELAGVSRQNNARQLKAGEQPLSGQLYVDHIRTISDFLASRQVESWMWGDMLAAPANFPRQHPALLNGKNGFSEIRTEIPKEVVICDWQYYESKGNFDTADYLVKNGYRVLGATWKNKKNIRLFSKHMAELEGNAEGMIATTWFHLQRKEMDLVTEIIDYSGMRFWSAK